VGSCAVLACTARQARAHTQIRSVGSSSSAAALEAEQELRRLTLELCRADAREYEVVLTSGATDSLRLVGGWRGLQACAAQQRASQTQKPACFAKRILQHAAGPGLPSWRRLRNECPAMPVRCLAWMGLE